MKSEDDGKVRSPDFLVYFSSWENVSAYNLLIQDFRFRALKRRSPNLPVDHIPYKLVN
ncbi:MAG: hypothetical protein RIE73_21945 [Coleofasciculus sp. C1-SOL-03]|uniref:hypothetical protein n=1 Tax=Coleofasciculus sp. C1-SOL-03 TaxID=3069522 RepID=UPI003301846C